MPGTSVPWYQAHVELLQQGLEPSPPLQERSIPTHDRSHATTVGDNRSIIFTHPRFTDTYVSSQRLHSLYHVTMSTRARTAAAGSCSAPCFLGCDDSPYPHAPNSNGPRLISTVFRRTLAAPMPLPPPSPRRHGARGGGGKAPPSGVGARGRRARHEPPPTGPPRTASREPPELPPRCCG